MIEFNFDSDFFNSEIDNLIADDLSNQFNELIDERDSIIDGEGYNVTTIEAKKMTHQEMLEITISILENVRMGHIKSAKKQVEDLTPIQIIQLFSMGKHYPDELERLKDLAIYW